MEKTAMRLQGQKQSGVKIAIQPYPYIKGEAKGKNRSLMVLEATTDEVYAFIEYCFQKEKGIEADED